MTKPFTSNSLNRALNVSLQEQAPPPSPSTICDKHAKQWQERPQVRADYIDGLVPSGNLVIASASA
ncbi:hypothetical protein [Burkholderia cepacia]|uniref:hypothetical protein n=1 Tax=Burkholderia cepacia TaxID=292 RepID=UPI0012D8DBC1|nr:hypothetical protein [Burkholderia cepacia]